MKIDWILTKKQTEAWDILYDKQITEIFFGGGAGGGKSVLGCAWLLNNCLTMRESRWLMGRAILKTLKESTLLTFFDLCKQWGLKSEIDYKYNSQESKITFYNGSEIFLKDLFAYPSDPEFDSLGSTEYTGAFIDECSEVSEKAKNIVMSRLRYKLEEFKAIPKLLMTSNPSKNFLYYDFYKPSKEGTMKEYRAFIPSLVQDNPYISPHYIENLKKLDKVSRARLLEGSFEYDDDPAKLIEYDAILDMFDLHPTGEIKTMSVDVARLGSDKTVIMIWQGLFVKDIYVYEKQETDKTEAEILRLADKEQIGKSRIIIDEDGVGGGICDHIKGCTGFVNNSSPIQTSKKQDEKYNYSNLKSQCYFLLADYINKRKIGITKNINPKYKELLIEDLEQVKRKDPDKDSKLAVVPKEKVKEILGRSTDFSDALSMGLYFEIDKREVSWFFG
jgi:PBSX family phage terminase large subunit